MYRIERQIEHETIAILVTEKIFCHSRQWNKIR
jgi:hypothetical protein